MTLIEILEHRRCYKSAGEKAFLEKLKTELVAAAASVGGIFMEDDFGHHPAGSLDGVGAFYVQVGGAPKVMFTCHTDTCHASDTPAKVWTDKGAGLTLLPQIVTEPVLKQEVILDDLNCYRLKNPKQGDVLGADDGVGVWICLKMIKAGKQGLYAFFRGEERGGLSSSWVVANEPERFVGIEAAVAFDRPDNYEIITHQGGERGCSDAFANALVAAFSSNGLTMNPSDRGVYTDTKEFFSLIPECINLGVGYGSQHSPSEWQDAEHAEKLLTASLAIDWDSLPFERDPSVRESKYGAGWNSSWYDYDMYGLPKVSARFSSRPLYEDFHTAEDFDEGDYDQLLEMALDDPDRIINLLLRVRAELKDEERQTRRLYKSIAQLELELLEFRKPKKQQMNKPVASKSVASKPVASKQPVTDKLPVQPVTKHLSQADGKLPPTTPKVIKSYDL